MNSLRFRFTTPLALLVLAAAAPFAIAADSRLDAALRDARTLVSHMQAFNTDGVASLLYTTPFEKHGVDLGQMKRQAAQQDADLRAAGAKYLRFTLGVPTAIFSREEGLFTLIPYSCVMAANGQKIQQDAFFLAASEDKGKNWKFLDGIATTRIPIEAILPKYEGPKPPDVRRFPVP